MCVAMCVDAECDTYPHLCVCPAHNQLLGQRQLAVQTLDGPLCLLRAHTHARKHRRAHTQRHSSAGQGREDYHYYV